MNHVIKDCVDELIKLYEGVKEAHPEWLNEHIVATHPEDWLFSNLSLTCKYVYETLMDLVKRFRLAPIDETEYVENDVKGICVLMFKPYWKTNDTNWVNESSRLYFKLSKDYKFAHGIKDDEPPDDLYNSFIIYFQDFVIDMVI